MDAARFDDQLIDIVAGFLIYSQVYSFQNSLLVYPPPELRDPEWQQTADEIRAGLPVYTALDHLAEHIPSEGLKQMADLFRRQWENKRAFDLRSEMKRLFTRLCEPFAVQDHDDILNLIQRYRFSGEAVQAPLLSLGNHLIVYLISPFHIGGIYAPIANLGLLNAIGSPEAIYFLRAFAESSSSREWGSISRDLLDQMGVDYRFSGIREEHCSVCQQPSSAVPGDYCWVCSAYVCRDHAYLIERAVFCCDDHLKQGRRTLV